MIPAFRESWEPFLAGVVCMAARCMWTDDYTTLAVRLEPPGPSTFLYILLHAYKL